MLFLEALSFGAFFYLVYIGNLFTYLFIYVSIYLLYRGAIFCKGLNLNATCTRPKFVCLFLGGGLNAIFFVSAGLKVCHSVHVCL